jgi:RNA polymerase sigma factor (sigma-70 family)
MPEPDDITLLRQYAGGDESAFTVLFERHVHLVYSAALRQVRNSSHADEITQAVFILLARKAKSLSPKTVLSGWLYQAARLTTASLIKREIRRQRREQEVYMQNSTEPDTSLWEQISPLLDDAMGRLGEQDRNAIVLRFFENRTPQEMAATMKLNEVTARKRLSRALEKLRTFFAKRGVVSTTAIIAGTISTHSVKAAPAGLAKAATAIAIAKGGAAPASLAALIKGVLWRMAWAQAKPVVLAGAVLLFGTAATMESVQTIHSAAGPDIEGDWEGTATDSLAIGVKHGEPPHCRVVLRISQTNGVYNVSADEIDLGKKDIRATHVTYKYPRVRFYMGDWGQCEAKLNSDATAMTLDFGLKREMDIVLQRTDTPDAVPERLTESEFAARPGENLQGYWKGNIIGFGPPAYLKIAAQSDGGYRGELNLPALGVNHWPVAVIDGRPGRPFVTFKLTCSVGMFQGRLNESGTAIVGNAFSSGIGLPGAFTRANYRPEKTPPESDYAFSTETDLQGHWTTEVDASLLTIVADGRLKKIPLDLDIAESANGTYSATLASPLAELFGAGDPIPATVFKHPLPDVQLNWRWVAAAFDGKLEDGKLVGKWNEGGESFAVTFERTAQ